MVRKRRQRRAEAAKLKNRGNKKQKKKFNTKNRKDPFLKQLEHIDKKQAVYQERTQKAREVNLRRENVRPLAREFVNTLADLDGHQLKDAKKQFGEKSAVFEQLIVEICNDWNSQDLLLKLKDISDKREVSFKDICLAFAEVEEDHFRPAAKHGEGPVSLNINPLMRSDDSNPFEKIDQIASNIQNNLPKM